MIFIDFPFSQCTNEEEKAGKNTNNKVRLSV